MKDYSELKMLAEKATPGLRVVTREWSDDDFEYQQEIFTVWSECETLEINIDGSFVGKDKADAEFIAAANPAVVLALVAEVEGLRKLPTAWSEVYEQSDELGALRDEKLAWLSERDQLKADNDLQAKEIEALRKAVEFCADCFRKISSGDGSGHADLAESILRIAGSTISKVNNK